MPVATRKQETVRHDLKSLPTAWVELRQLSYDEMLERRDGATQVLMDRGVGKNSNPQMAIKVANRWANTFSFPRCIVGHNLTDADGNALDFSKPQAVFLTLDPKVGAEIEALIDELNQEEDEDFTRLSDSSSPDEENLLQNGSEPS